MAAKNLRDFSWRPHGPGGPSASPSYPLTSTLTIVGTLPQLLAAISDSPDRPHRLPDSAHRHFRALSPQYFRGEMFTAYELMRRCFGERVRKLTASIFLVTGARRKIRVLPFRW
jgi:hypothetical protein